MTSRIKNPFFIGLTLLFMTLAGFQSGVFANYDDDDDCCPRPVISQPVCCPAPQPVACPAPEPVACPAPQPVCCPAPQPVIVTRRVVCPQVMTISCCPVASPKEPETPVMETEKQPETPVIDIEIEEEPEVPVIDIEVTPIEPEPVLPEPVRPSRVKN